MIEQTLNLNLVPKGICPRLYVTQYDYGSRTLKFAIYNDNTRFTLTGGMSARIQGTKADGHGFDYAATVDTSNNLITVDLTQQMTAAKGDTKCEIVINKTGERIGTLNFVIVVQPAGLNEDTDTSGSDFPDIIAGATAEMENAEAWARGTKNGTAVSSSDPQYHNNAKYYAESIGTYTSDAEAWARGTRNGSAVGSSDATYHNNSKYYSEQANSSASSANTNALKAEGYAVGTQNGTSVQSGTYYHNNAAWYSSQAKNSAINANTDAGTARSDRQRAESAANGADTSALKSEGYAVGTQNGTAVTSGSPYYENNAYYWAQRAASYVGTFGISDAEWALIEQVI